ncbi:AGAP006228-PA-like protein [Anopheles sinensis]|uniref:Carboxylic ester hydrolase n=1 Tax=Anopheles sinensis TaxID=74873 RepID=A0A084WK46_ANOSI|nr:AGAP006228-PA-like protein [Anopheles sinensis]
MANSELVVNTRNGPVQGTTKTSLYGTGYVSFQGIPYAKPPDPSPPENWTSILDCTTQCEPCYHFDRRVNKIVGSEDSLKLNIFARTIKPSKPLPVMVYIYGGGFTEGTSGTELYGPDYLIEKDIVLVSFNYRVGALGFLCCQSPEAGVPGNAGLKDQRMALKWVQENIASFGGNPNSVTLFGHSAGGASVQYHTISEVSKNLFQRAIIMSGSTMCDWSLSPQRSWPVKLAKKIGWQGAEEDGEDAALQFLRQASPEDIVDNQEKLFGPQEIQEGLLTPFAPTIEPYETEVCFIPKSPLEMSRTCWGNGIDVMIGGTSEEGLILLPKVKPRLADMLKDPRLFVGNVPFHLKLSLEQRVAFGEQLKQLYYPHSEPAEDHLNGFILMATDRIFWHALHRTVLSRAKYTSEAKTFVYRVSVDSAFFNHYRIHMIDPNMRGTSHADELSYLFSNIFAQPLDKETFEYAAIQHMVNIFTSFATNSDPNYAGTEGLSWEAVPKTAPPYKCLNVSNNGVAVHKLPETRRMKVWDSFYVNDALV